MPDFSVVIVNWNSADYLRACLTSLYRNVQEIEFEVVVVDNASCDGCAEMLEAHYPQVRLILSNRNLGFARACNLGCQCSSGRVVLFLNPDTEIPGDALQSMFHWLDSHPSAGAVGPRLLNSDGSLQISCVQAFPTLLNQLLDSDLLRRVFPNSRLWGTAALNDPRAPATPVDSLSGACLMVRRTVFEAAGQFNAEFFMYSDDLDLCLNIHRAGYMVVCLPWCEVMHHGGRSSSRQSQLFADILQRESMARFFLYTRGRACAILYRLLMTFSAFVRLSIVLSAQLFAGQSDQRERLRASSRRWFSILGWSLGFDLKSCSIGTRTHA